MSIYELHKENNNGEGVRSIGEWSIHDLQSLESEIKQSTEFNDHQKEYAFELFKNGDEEIIVMEEAYTETRQIHCVNSFLYWYLANLESKQAVDKLTEQDIKCYEICLDSLSLHQI